MNSKVFERGVFLMKYNEIKLEEKEEKLEILRQETPLPLACLSSNCCSGKDFGLQQKDVTWGNAGSQWQGQTLRNWEKGAD